MARDSGADVVQLTAKLEFVTALTIRPDAGGGSAAAALEIFAAMTRPAKRIDTVGRVMGTPHLGRHHIPRSSPPLFAVAEYMSPHCADRYSRGRKFPSSFPIRPGARRGRHRRAGVLKDD